MSGKGWSVAAHGIGSKADDQLPLVGGKTTEASDRALIFHFSFDHLGAAVEHEVVGPDLVRSRGRLRPGPARSPPAGAAACAGPASPLRARAGTPAPRSWRGRRARERLGCVDSRSADRPARARPSAPAPARRSPPCADHRKAPSVPQRAACRPAAAKGRDPSHSSRPRGGPARSPVFSGDLLHYLDLEVALGHKLLSRAFSASNAFRRRTSLAASVPKRLRQT